MDRPLAITLLCLALTVALVRYLNSVGALDAFDGRSAYYR